MKKLTVWKISDKLFDKSGKYINKLLKQIREEIYLSEYQDTDGNHAVLIEDIEKVFDEYLKKD